MSLLPLIPLLQRDKPLGRFVFSFLEPELIEALRILCEAEIRVDVLLRLAAKSGWTVVLQEYYKFILDQDLQYVLMCDAVGNNQVEAMKLLKNCDCNYFGEAFGIAVTNGHIEAMVIIREWGLPTQDDDTVELSASPASDFNVALRIAANGGHIGAMKLLKDWGASSFDSGLYSAAGGGGYIEAMKLLKEWGATDFNGALYRAANGGYVEAMKLLKEWGATNFDGALHRAAGDGRIEAMKLLKEWGATDFNDALYRAASFGQIDAMKLLKDWGAANFSGALWNAAHGSHIEAMNLLRSWGANNFTAILSSITKTRNNVKVVRLLENWKRGVNAR